MVLNMVKLKIIMIILFASYRLVWYHSLTEDWRETVTLELILFSMIIQVSMAQWCLFNTSQKAEYI